MYLRATENARIRFFGLIADTIAIDKNNKGCDITSSSLVNKIGNK